MKFLLGVAATIVTILVLFELWLADLASAGWAWCDPCP